MIQIICDNLREWKNQNVFSSDLPDFCQYHCQLVCIRRMLVASVQQNTKMSRIHSSPHIKLEPVSHSCLVYIYNTFIEQLNDLIESVTILCATYDVPEL